jgi:UDP-glucose 4-epimerase
VNILGTLNALEAARAAGVRRFVFASSGAALGEQEPPLHERLPPRPLSPYGASKLAGEAYCSAYARCFAIEAVALRFANAYGPLSDHKTSVIAKLIGEALDGKPWEIHGDGGQTRDFIHVEDVAQAIRLAASVEAIGGEVFQIATGVETTIADLAAKLRSRLLRHGQQAPGIVPAPPRTGDVRRSVYDTAKAQTRLGWRAQIGLDEGLERTVSWFLDR